MSLLGQIFTKKKKIRKRKIGVSTFQDVSWEFLPVYYRMLNNNPILFPDITFTKPAFFPQRVC